MGSSRGSRAGLCAGPSPKLGKDAAESPSGGFSRGAPSPGLEAGQRGAQAAAGRLAGSGERARRVLSPVWAPGPGGGTRLPSPGLRWALSPGRELAARRARRGGGRGASGGRGGSGGLGGRGARTPGASAHARAPATALRLYPSPGRVEITLTTRPAGSGWAARPTRPPRARYGPRAPNLPSSQARPPLAALPLARPGRAPGGPRSQQ